MDKVFSSTWVWVAHASEIPEAGSYKTTFVGRQPVVVVRDRKQQVHVLLNRCRHRAAATVCEGHKGKTNSFVCPYHGWSYSLDGALRGVPSPSYGDLLDKADFPLIKLRVEEYAGMIFATFKDDIKPLVDYLGPAKKWMDLFMKQGGGFPGEGGGRTPLPLPRQLEDPAREHHRRLPLPAGA